MPMVLANQLLIMGEIVETSSTDGQFLLSPRLCFMNAGDKVITELTEYTAFDNFIPAEIMCLINDA